MIEPRTIRRILVIRRKAMGDALVTLPAIRQLKAAFPDAHLDLVMDRPFAALLQRLANDLTVLSWPPPRGGMPWPLRLRAARYDLVLDYLGNPRTALWTALSGAPIRVGYDLPRRRWAYNVRVPRNRIDGRAVVQFAGEAFLDPLRALGLATEPWKPGAAAGAVDEAGPELGDEYRRWFDDHDRGDQPRAALMFSATWPAKAWPARNGAELYRLLEDRGLAPLMVTGPGDEQLEADLRREHPQAAFAPPTSLLELSHLLASCTVFIGTDNGARHLAAILGVPTVTVFGPTDPGGWNPDDPRHVAVVGHAPCAPCDLTRCPVPGHPCLDDLSASRVAETVERLLSRTGTKEERP